MAKAKPKQFSVTRKGLLLWCCAFVLVGGWLFLLGILVGRGLVPQPFELNSFERELQTQRSEEISVAQARLEQDAQEGLPAEPLRIEDLRQPQVDTEVRAVRRESVTGPDGRRLKKRRVPPKPKPLGKAQRPDKIARKSAPTGSAAGATTAAKVDPKPATASKAKTSRASDSVAAALAGMKAKFTLQVASVREQAAAEQIVKKLKQAGHRAYQTTGTTGNGVWYRVRVGAYKTRKAAEAALNGFKGSGYKPIVIQR